MGKEKPVKKSDKASKKHRSASGHQRALFPGPSDSPVDRPNAELCSAEPNNASPRPSGKTSAMSASDHLIDGHGHDSCDEVVSDFPGEAGEVALEVQVSSDPLLVRQCSDPRPSARHERNTHRDRPRPRSRSRSPISRSPSSSPSRDRYSRVRSNSKDRSHQYDLYQEFLLFQNFMNSRGGTQPQSRSGTPAAALGAPAPKSPVQHDLVIHAPDHTGFSEDEADESFDSRSIISNQDPGQPSEELKLSSEFGLLIDNLHFVLGDDLPSRKFSSSSVRALSQLEDVVEEKNPVSFPHSAIIPSTFDCLHQQMWGDAGLKVDDPNSLPSSLVAGKRLGKRKIPKYRERFYSLKSDPLQPTAAEVGVSMESYSTVKESSIKIKAEEVRGIERQARKSLLAVNAMDVLLGAIRKVDSRQDPSEVELEAKRRFFASLVLAVKHAAEFSATAVALAMNARRKAFLEATPESLLPQAAKNWLLNQPFLPPSGDKHSLFGDVVPQLNKFTAKHNKLHGITKKPSDSQRQKSSRPPVLANSYHAQSRPSTPYAGGRGSRPFGRGQSRGGPSNRFHSRGATGSQGFRGAQPPPKKFP